MINPTSLKKLLYTFLCISLYQIATAKVSGTGLCLARVREVNGIDYNSDAVNGFLRFQDYKIVLFGEVHNGSFNPEFQYHLITDVNRRCGIRHIFMEMSVSCAWHFNQYLKTGDTSYLSTRGLVATYGKWPQFWKRMFTYNQRLPDSQKLVFHGVDFERTEVFQTIMDLSPKGTRPPASLQAMMDTVAAHLSDPPLGMYTVINGKMIEFDNSGFNNAVRHIQSAILSHKEDAKAFFGANYAVAIDIAENNCEAAVNPKHRNRTMFHAIKRIVAEQKIEKFMGIFGAEHTSYSPSSSISNAVKGLPGIRNRDILNITEVVYNLRRRSDSAVIKVGNDEQIMAMNGTCKATIYPASQVPHYGRKVDYVIIGDAE